MNKMTLGNNSKTLNNIIVYYIKYNLTLRDGDTKGNFY